MQDYALQTSYILVENKKYPKDIICLSQPTLTVLSLYIMNQVLYVFIHT
jgi:hypothetical protein